MIAVDVEGREVLVECRLAATIEPIDGYAMTFVRRDIRAVELAVEVRQLVHLHAMENAGVDETWESDAVGLADRCVVASCSLIDEYRGQ